LRSCYRGTDGNTSQMWVLQLCILNAIGLINAFFCELCSQWLKVVTCHKDGDWGSVSVIVTCHKDGDWGSVSVIVKHLPLSLPPTMISSFLIPDGGLQAYPAFPASAVKSTLDRLVICWDQGERPPPACLFQTSRHIWNSWA
jgi:hypothetical protein